jgi:peptide/nickel transport system permease protein
VRVLRFLARRLLILAGLMLALTAVTYFVYSRIPTEPGRYLYPNLNHIPDRDLRRADHLLGVDRSLPRQYGSFVWNALHGDLGISWENATIGADNKVHGTAVAGTLGHAAIVTGSLALGGIALLLLIAVPLGMLAASRPRSFLDRAILTLSLVGISTHPLVVGVVLQTFFGTHWHVLPASGYCSPFGGAYSPPNLSGTFSSGFGPPCSGAGAWATHLVLPWLTFALLFTAIYMRMVRASLLETLGEQYVRTARGKGASEFTVVRRHALPNAALPVLTMAGMDVATALGVAIYVETVFRLPGLGRLALTALRGDIGFDLHYLVGIVVFTTLAVVVMNLVVDLLYVLIDPRITGVGPKRAVEARVI